MTRYGNGSDEGRCRRDTAGEMLADFAGSAR